MAKDVTYLGHSQRECQEAEETSVQLKMKAKLSVRSNIKQTAFDSVAYSLCPQPSLGSLHHKISQLKHLGVHRVMYRYHTLKHYMNVCIIRV